MESDNKSGDGSGAGGRLLVDESSWDVPNDKKRFQIDLKQDETTIVSWTKLLRDAGIPVDHSPPPSPEPPRRFHQEDESRSECSNIILKKEKDEQSTSPMHIKEEYGEVNGSMLESTILEMETMVAKLRPLHGDVQDTDHSEEIKCRLPQELEQKLENVSRLAMCLEACCVLQGRISDELIMRRMSILGHWLKPRTLKRCLRGMVPADLSSCQGDGVRFSQIKKEVAEMIRLRTLPMETKDRSSNKIMELPTTYKAKYNMDHEMEDKICDFYDIYVQGMEEIKSSEV